MSKRHKVRAQVVKEGKDYEHDLSKKPLTDQEIRDHLPVYWKKIGEASKNSMSVPIPGTDFFT